MALFGSDFDGISVNLGEGASGFNIPDKRSETLIPDPRVI